MQRALFAVFPSLPTKSALTAGSTHGCQPSSAACLSPGTPWVHTAAPAYCPGPPQRAACTTRTSSEHPTWGASTPICCRADLKNSGEGFPTTSASIPQAYWGEGRDEATGEGPTCGGGLPLGNQGRSATGQGPPRGGARGLGGPPLQEQG